MSHEFQNMRRFQAEEGSYNRIQDIFPADSKESAKLPSDSLQNKEICTVKKDGLGQEVVLRNNLRTDFSPDRPAASKAASSPSSIRSNSGLFDASRGDALKKLLDRKRAN